MQNINDFIDQIHHADCLELMKKMPEESIDLVVTDPPYLVNYRSSDGRTVPNDNNNRWLVPAYAQIYRLLKRDSFCISFYSWTKVDKFFQAWKSAGFRPVGHLVWVKNYHSRERFVRYCHESAYLLAKGYPPLPKIALCDVLDWRYTNNTLHPTQKPLMAIIPLILAFSETGGIVLDPFAGSGTTTAAAQELNRRYIGIEINQRYCDIARERMLKQKRE